MKNWETDVKNGQFIEPVKAKSDETLTDFFKRLTVLSNKGESGLAEYYFIVFEYGPGLNLKDEYDKGYKKYLDDRKRVFNGKVNQYQQERKKIIMKFIEENKNRNDLSFSEIIDFLDNLKYFDGKVDDSSAQSLIRIFEQCGFSPIEEENAYLCDPSVYEKDFLFDESTDKIIVNNRVYNLCIIDQFYIYIPDNIEIKEFTVEDLANYAVRNLLLQLQSGNIYRLNKNFGSECKYRLYHSNKKK